MNPSTFKFSHIMQFNVYKDNNNVDRLVAREILKPTLYDSIRRENVLPYTYMDTGEEFWIEETSIHRYPKLTYEQAVNLFPEDFV